ncbi:natural killer cell receptor 2B4-like isoform X2 [Silurus meridionalis]|uniref:natural killer cell receptor 2B4-like isoform X2 n=1 Tax=Silurus meridionalis TaxID=175797 RepID=UPI001EEB4A3A|nr:natural killer cell receptor 2B4-like isoform X2 [Silurus meridionalis]
MAQAMQLVFFLYLLASVEATDVFRLVNSSVQLDVQKQAPKDVSVKWTFNTNRTIVRNIGTLSRNYKDKAGFNTKTFSLTLKNLQKNDSGIYAADAENDDMTTNVAKYQLCVLDPVKKPVLNVSHQESNGTCNVTFICKTQNFSVTSNCYSDQCDNKTEKVSGNFLLSLYIRNDFIICNHSNPVSWETATMEMEHVRQLCLSKGDKEPPAGPPLNNPVILLISVVTLTVGLGFISIIIYFLYKKYSRTTESDTRVYKEVKEGNELQTIEESEKLETAGTVYCNVRKPSETYDESTVRTANPGNKNQGAENIYKSLEFTTPQDIYYTVNKNDKIL